MYPIIHIISALIRQFLLPNPFVNMFTNQALATFFNMVIGGIIIHILSYIMTGAVYEKYSAPTLGSILYLFNYCLITGLLIFITWLIHINLLAITLFLITYIILLILFNKITYHRYDY